MICQQSNSCCVSSSSIRPIPSNEEACIDYLVNLLRKAGIEPILLSNVAGRPNLVARLKGAGQMPPLLLYGHVDVVPALESSWQHPPFAGGIAHGYVWGYKN